MTTMTRQQRRAKERQIVKNANDDNTVDSTGLLSFGAMYRDDVAEGTRIIFTIEEGHMTPYELSMWTKDTAENMSKQFAKYTKEELFEILENQVKMFNTFFCGGHPRDMEKGVMRARATDEFYKNAIAQTALIYYMQNIRKVLKSDNHNGMWYGHNLRRA